MISIRTARSSPAEISTSSIAAAEIEWIPICPRLDRDPRAPVGHVERVGDSHHPGLDGVRLAAAAMPDDRVQRLGDHDRPLGSGSS